MGLLDVDGKQNFVEDLQSRAKVDLTNEILEDSSNYLKGSQVMELNKTLNRCFESYEIFADVKIDIDDNYQDKNKDLVESYIRVKKLEGLSQRTIDVYEYSINKFVEWVDKPLTNVTTEDFRAYLQYYQSLHNCSNTTLDSQRRYFSSFFGWCHTERLIPINPIKKIKKIKSAKKLKKPYTNEEIERMRHYLFNKSYPGGNQIRNQAIFEMLLSSGVRIAELVGLNRNDIDLLNRSCVVFGKGGKERECYFSAKAQYCIKKYLDSRKDDHEALFIGKHGHRLKINGIERMISELGKEVNVKAHPHKFRRTFATGLINKGVPIEQVKTLLGHTSIDTTMIYAMVDQENVKFNHRKYIE